MASKPKKERASAQEVALARQAARADQRYESAFRPLEQEAINELSTADAGKRSEMLAGRSNADLEAAAAEGKALGLRADAASQTLGGGATSGRNFDRASAVESDRISLRTKADQTARDSIDQDTLSVIQTGRGVARQTQNALTASARNASQLEQASVAAENMEDMARLNAVSEIAMGAGLRAYDHFGGKKKKSRRAIPEGEFMTAAPHGFRENEIGRTA